jgi:chromate transporter
MSSPPAPIAFAAQIALLSLISFGGIPSVLPDIHSLVVVTKGWATDREFADFYAIAQAMPGLPMILMMSLIGWKVGGLAGALASAVATCGPSSAVAFVAFRLGDRFRDAPWQRIVRRGLVPVTVGIVIASGYVLARAADNGWQATAITGAAAGLILGTRISPLWILIAAGAIGGLGLI